MGTKEFLKDLKQASSLFKKLDNANDLLIICHNDCDGICAAAILYSSFLHSFNNVEVVSYNFLTEDLIKNISKKSAHIVFFADIGSSNKDLIEEMLCKKTVILLDHHLNSSKKTKENIIEINPTNYGIDGTKEISASGVAFLFAKEASKENEIYAHLAVIGASGDLQLKEKVDGLNKKILEIAIKNKLIEKEKCLRIFGSSTKPLAKALSMYTDFSIPNACGTIKEAEEFLVAAGIDPNEHGKPRKLDDLDKKELAMLEKKIFAARVGEKNPKDIYGIKYLLNNYPKEISDIREISTLINACGRMGNVETGIGVCLNEINAINKAYDILSDYRRELKLSMDWFSKNNNNEKISVSEKYIILDCAQEVSWKIAGPFCSLVAHTKEAENKLIFCLADTQEGLTKISSRAAKGAINGTQLNEILFKAGCDINGCNLGGHKISAGGIIPTSSKKEYIENLKKELKTLLI
ncbi:MAG: DHH family phosphoesterase [archaeon]